MSRRPRLVEFPQHTQFEPLMAEIQRYAVSDSALPNRDILLSHAGWEVARFIHGLWEGETILQVAHSPCHPVAAAGGSPGATAGPIQYSRLDFGKWDRETSRQVSHSPSPNMQRRVSTYKRP
jgi:hypothetical protein